MGKKKQELKINRLPQFLPETDLIKEAIEFLQLNIRTKTINPPGNELVLAKIIKNKIDTKNIQFVTTKIIETGVNRGNLIVDIEGTDPDNNPTWGFASHLDVVPAKDEKDWDYPPFSGELVQCECDTYIWGRGTLDMKYIGCSYYIALFTMLEEGIRPKGNIKLIYEADEEVSGHNGIEILINDYWDDVKVDYFITEGGGFQLPSGNDFILAIAEKGKIILKITANGITGHGSLPGKYEDMAMFKINKVLNRIKKKHPKIEMTEEYEYMIEKITLPSIIKFLFRRKRLIRGILTLLDKLSPAPMKTLFLALISSTIAPTIISGGVKENVVSKYAELILDIRMVPGKTEMDIYNMMKRILGKKLFNELKIETLDFLPHTSSPINTELMEKITNVMNEMIPGSNMVPYLLTGGTDSRRMRMKQIPAYGFIPYIFDKDVSSKQMTEMIHGTNERISLTNYINAIEFA